MPIYTTARPGRALKKVILILAAVIFLIVAAAVLLTPTIAASFIAGRHEVNLPSGTGAVELRDVAISWGGPQRIGKVALLDPQGKPMADLKVEARTSLLGAALGGGNIGTIALSGTIDVTEDQLTPHREPRRNPLSLPLTPPPHSRLRSPAG